MKEIPHKFNVPGNSIYTYEIKQNGIEANLVVYENQVDFELEKKFMSRETLPSVSVGDIPDLNIEHGSEAIMDMRPTAIYRSTTITNKATAPARIVGDVVHRALQLWKFPDQGETGFIDWAVAEMKIRGVIRESEVKNGYRRVKDIIDRFQDHELFERMINAETLLHEVPYSINSKSSTAQSGAIDALFKEDDRWYIVEF